jgi:hypothetical protein
MLRIAIATFLIFICVSHVDVRPRRRRDAVQTSVSSASWSGGPQAVASAKAQRAAGGGIKGHLGGGFEWRGLKENKW